MVDYHDTEGDFIHYWESWSAIAGGEAVEASEDGEELASKLINLVENAPEDTACATTAVPIVPSANTPGTEPTVLTPRFLQPGSQIVLNPPSGKEFCSGQLPALGPDIVTSLEEATPSKLVFRTPPDAASMLAVTNLFGIPGARSPYGVDNFRYPWGFSVDNNPGTGAGSTYDKHIAVTPQDIDSVFKEIGGPGNEVYEWVKEKAEAELDAGLCYGFSLLSRSLYDDAHGGDDPLAFADSSGFAVTPGTEPYALTENSTGSHGLTHALLRAGVSQWSPEARLSWHAINSAGSAEAELNAAFQHSHPAVVIIKFLYEGGHHGHALLAFNYQKTGGGGVAIDVVEPDLPWNEERPASDYEMMQIDVAPNGSWTYTGAFGPVSGSAGSLFIAPEPRSPGGLTLWYNAAAPIDTAIKAGGGAANLAISYSGKPGHGIPSDVRYDEVANDAADEELEVPPSHKLITISQANGAAPTDSVSIDGRGFLDRVRMGGGGTYETVATSTGGVLMARATGGDSLTATRVLHGVQNTVRASFRGKVLQAKLEVTPSGQVSLTTAGGNGHVTLSLATYTASGQRAVAPPMAVALHGRAHIRRHTPKIKRHKRGKHKR